ncbi:MULTISPECIES: PD40 domain-containing protein [unclassified Coleofasciculus]|uniref:WD40 domain-containing protein n=1 Tax=unclassified Coleofasciculus TaxID=2692782 RepID=UPI0018814BE9|nr:MULTISPECIES: PD40 domain-containing protein [unclassified Coleofasciculus]MBE9127145.1 PD40 domain-containing protein [Coleofasciculus sp. LEGE 07081]MBE9150282.1 PD40 domain-containing protein [Coleofasciculus sp. LEGE 07092]
MTEPNEIDDIAADNEESLQTLIRAITLSQGEFSLILARCNYSHLREQIVQQLREQCPIKIHEVVLDSSVKTLYSTIEKALQDKQQGRGDASVSALMIFGLESVDAIDPVIVATNHVREEFRKNFPFLIVFWVNDEVLQKFTRLAPDFDSWTTTIEFAIATDELINLLNQNAHDAFQQILGAGAGRFLDNAVLNIAVDSWYPSELNSALEDLQNRIQELEPELEANLEFLLGRNAQANEQMEEARQHYEKSLVFWQQSQNTERYGCLLFYLGLWWRRYAVLHRFEYVQACAKARDYFKQCVEVFKQSNRPVLAARFINALGEVLTRLEDWDELEIVAKDSVKLYQTYPDSHQRLYSGYAYGLLAEVALKKAAWSEAKKYAALALQKNTEPELVALGSQYADTNWGWAWKQYQSLYLFLLAKAQRHLNQLEETVKNLETAREKNNPQYDPQLYIDILSELRSLYFQQGEYLKAFEVKQEQKSIEAQYGFRPFTGAGSLRPIKRIINPAFDSIDPQERARERITASGRRSDLNGLIEKLSRNDYKLIVIHGMSGVGKSSLLWAGLVPELQQNPIGDRTALPITLRYYTNWVADLGKKLAEALPEIEETVLAPTLAAIKMIIEQLKFYADRHLLTVLIFDQFEEFFFVCTDLRERRQFYEFLRDCLNIPYVKVILSLREDYLHYLLECDRFANLDVINNNILDKNIRCYLGDFSPERAKSVIRELTDRSQFYLEPALIDELVQDLAGELGEIRPIELQVVGAQLQTENITTLEQYHQLGANPKEKLVQRSLEEVIRDGGIENERAARLVLYLLTNENGTRPLKTRAELEADLKVLGFESETKQLDLVLEILIGSGLVFLVPDSPANRYQLVHDYLVAFIRQQQAPGLLAELAEAKEKQKLTEAQLRQALREKEEALRKEQEERKRAEIAEIEALSSLSQVLWLSHKQLEALLAIIKAGKKLQNMAGQASSELKMYTRSQLYQTLDQVRERNRLEGHSDKVYSVRFSPDGQIIASASSDHTVKLWRIDGTLLQTFKLHSSGVNSINFSPDGQTLTSTSSDHTVKLWRIDGTLLQTFEWHSNGVNSVNFSPDGQTIASVSIEGKVNLWSTDGTLLQTFEGNRNYGIHFSPDGQIIALVGGDTVNLWRTDGTLLQSMGGHSRWRNSISFSPDGQILALAGREGTVKLWRTDGTLLQTLGGHSSGVNSISFSPDGQTIASAGREGTVKLWHLDGTVVQIFQDHSSGVNSISFSPDGQTIASASADNTVKLWALDSKLVQTFHFFNKPITRIYSISFSPDGQMIASAGADTLVKLWGTDGRLLQIFRGHSERIYTISFSPDGQMIASASADTLVKLWRLDGTLLQTFQGHEGAASSVSFIPNGQTIASASGNGTIRLWGLDGTLLQTFRGHKNWVSSVSFSPDGQMFASASGDGTVKLWRLDGRLVQTFQEHLGGVTSISFSPDGQTIVSVSADSTIKLWGLDGTLLQTFQGHSDRVYSVSFSPDGQTIASASADTTVKLWSLDGTLLQSFQAHQVRSISFSPDGKTIAWAGDNNTVQLRSLLSLDNLLVQGCNWLRDYLKTNPNVSESDRTLCDDICT